MIELENVTKLFNGRKIVDSVSFRAEKGETIVFLGPSGSGKTTLLRLIAGFESPNSGEIFINGRRVNNLPPFSRNVGMVFQDLALWPHMTVEENVEFCLKEKGEKKQAVSRLLDSVGLSAYARYYPAQLSGGEKQRVALARSLAAKPGILLLDEPMSNIDPLFRTELKKLIDGFHKSLGITLIYVTHDHNEAMQMPGRLIILHEGRIEQIGTPQEICCSPKTEFVKRFMALPGKEEKL